MNEAPAGTIIYHNVAPRADDEQAREGNAGERLAFARLPTGVRVIGVNAGQTFSFVRDAAEELRWAAVADAGSQFRSRDLFPQAAAHIALGQPDALAEEIARAEIPDAPPNAIAYIDGYGNLKTTIKSSSNRVPVGSTLRVRIGKREQRATVSDGSFGVEHGQMTFAPGSSGWKDKDGTETLWMELFLRGGNAWEAFGHPSVEDEIQLETVS
jgi:S-adenosylmethionine hydrolase